jgi:hypothetical protein
MLAGAPGITVTAACPVRPPEVAVIVALPTRAPVIRPELTEATVGFELDHVTFDAGEPLIVAVACTEVPDAMVGVGSVISRVGGGSVAVAVNVTEPAPGEEAVTVCSPAAGPRVQRPEIAIPDASVSGSVGPASTPPPVATTYDTTAPMIRFPAASLTSVHRGSLSRDPLGPD